MSFSRANWKNFWKTLRLSTPTHSRHSHLWTFNPWTILCHLPPIRSYRFCSRPEVEAFCWQSLANLSWHIPTNSIEKNIRFCFQLLLSQWCCIILPRSESKKTPGKPWKFWPWDLLQVRSLVPLTQIKEFTLNELLIFWDALVALEWYCLRGFVPSFPLHQGDMEEMRIKEVTSKRNHSGKTMQSKSIM